MVGENSKSTFVVEGEGGSLKGKWKQATEGEEEGEDGGVKPICMFAL